MPGVVVLEDGGVLFVLKPPNRQHVAGDGIRRAAEEAGGKDLALGIGSKIRILRSLAGGGDQIDIAAIDDIHHGADLLTAEIGESIVLGTADKSEGLTDQHRIGMGATTLERGAISRRGRVA